MVLVTFGSSLTFAFTTAYGETLKVRVGASPIGIGYNQNDGNILVTNSGSHSISIINGDTNRLESNILVGRVPYAVTYDPVGDFIYVVNIGENSVSVVSGGSNRIINTIPVGVNPSSISFDIVNRRVYVCNYNSNHVSVIDGSGKKVLANVSVGNNPIDLAISPSNHGVYVANAGSNDISVINSATNNVIGAISVGSHPTAVAYNSNNNKAYVANRDDGSVSVIDGVTNTVSETIDVDPFPVDIAVNPNSNTVYVAHTQAANQSAEEKVSSYLISVIDGVSDKVVKKIELTSRPGSMVVSPRSDLVYVTNSRSDFVSVIDGKTNQFLSLSPILPPSAKLTAIVDLALMTAVPLVIIVLLLFRKVRDHIREKVRATLSHVVNSRTRFFGFVHKVFRLIKRSWIRSGLILSVLSLIVMPALVVVTVIHHSQLSVFFLQYSQYKELEWEKSYWSYFVLFVQGAFIVILLLYPPYPAPFSSERYFRDRGFETAVVEYDYVKKILYVAAPLFIIITLVPFFQTQLDPYVRDYLSVNLDEQLQHPAFRISQGIIFLIVFAGSLKLIFAVVRKRFRLYYAIGCFKIIRNWDDRRVQKDEVQKMSYVIKGLDSYNMYLQRHLDLHINDIKSIYSKIGRLPLKRKNEAIRKISDIFLSDEMDTNSLRPARFLYSFSTGRREPGVADGRFLTTQSLFDKIKDLAAFAAIIIPLGIAMTELYLNIIRPN